METPKFSTENVMQAQFDKTFNALATQNILTNSVDQSNQSFIQSLSETRNIMSQFALPQANTNTVNVGEFQNMLNLQNLKAPAMIQTSLPMNLNYGLMNALYNDPKTMQQGFVQHAFQSKPLENGNQQNLSEDTKPVLSVFSTPAMQGQMDNIQIKQEAVNILTQVNQNTNNQTPILDSNFVVKSETVPPLTDTTANINTNASVMCDICGKICKDSSRLKIHKYTHSKDKPFKCEICFKSFLTSFKLKAHINIHGNEKPHHCPVCNKAFHSKTYVDRHMVVHSTDKPHRCETCDKAFGRKEHLKRHLLTHSGEKPHKCTICEKSFRCKSNLIMHVLKHNNPEQQANTNDNNSVNSNNNTPAPKQRRPRQQHHCTLCNAVFTTKASFNAHILEHTGRKPYQCQKCDKCFNDKSSLCRHNMVHTGEKPYGCQHCEKFFARRDHLQRHTLTHTGEKPHQCKLCPKWFKLKRDLNAHIEIHKENQPSDGGSTTDNPGSKSATPNSQVSTDQGSVTMSTAQVFNTVPVTPVTNPVAAQITPIVQAPVVVPAVSQASLANPIAPIQLPLPQLPLGAIPAHMIPNLPQPPPGHVIMNTHPISQLLNQLNMQQLHNGQIALNAVQPNPLPVRPALGNDQTSNQQQGATTVSQIPNGQALLSNFFGAQQNAVGQFTLPAISSVMTPQHNAPLPEFQPANVKIENSTASNFPPPNKSETVVCSTAYTLPVKSENVAAEAAFVQVKAENNACGTGYLPTVTSNNNIINLGMSPAIAPVMTTSHVYTPPPSDVMAQSFAPSQKATTDGDIYSVENINQLGQSYGSQLKQEVVVQNGLFGQDESMNSSLISNALNTVANCQLST